MKSHLSIEQAGQLESLLVERQRDLERQRAEHEGGQSRVEHAEELLQQESDDVPQRESEREMDIARIEMVTQELTAVTAALRRLREKDYGTCADCGTDIPFARLKVEPWALRCVACEEQREKAR